LTALVVGSPTLVGVGVGPGDPELITVKALAAFAAADVILVPATEASRGEAGRAEQVILAACPQQASKIQRVAFSMAQRRGVGAKRRESWQVGAQAAVQAFDEGAQLVAFATVGDPSIYSTFSYLAAQVASTLPELQVSVIPGITAMQALAATTGTSLVEGRESLALVSVTAGLDAVTAALDSADTVVAYKVGQQLPALIELIDQRGRDGVLGVNVGLDDEQLSVLSQAKSEAAPYFATVLITPQRTSIGGSL
jgi:precorrin-2/cobalt-factor-2 C20-methyltransferase